MTKVYECATPEFTIRKTAEAAFDVSGADADFKAMFDAEKAYEAVRSKLLAQWQAIPAGAGKDSAHQNAADMMYNEELMHVNDEAAWFRAAISTYEINGVQ